MKTATGTESRVCELIAQRQRMGIAKYGQTVAGNPLSHGAWLRHALEEALDMAIYLQRSIEQLEADMRSGAVKEPAAFIEHLSPTENRLTWLRPGGVYTALHARAENTWDGAESAAGLPHPVMPFYRAGYDASDMCVGGTD